MQLLEVFGKYFDTKKIFTFGNKDSQGFIERTPREHSGVSIILTEQSHQQVPTFNNGHLGYDERSIMVQVQSKTNGLSEVRNLAYDIYNHLKQNPLLGDTGIFGIRTNTPDFIRMDEANRFIYVITLECYYNQK